MPFRPIPATAVAALLLVATVPATATAATVAPTRGCFLDRGADTTAAVTATGFTPGAPLQISVDGTPLDVSASADGAGGAAGSFPVPGLRSGTLEASHQVTISDGTANASAIFSTTRVRGDFTPSSGNPATLRVSFSANGMNLVKPSRVYVHYVTPRGKLKKTVSLGKAKGPCGHIAATKPRKLFGFKAERGNWTLQYDTAKRYRRGTSKTAYPWATVRVKIRRIAR